MLNTDVKSAKTAGVDVVGRWLFRGELKLLSPLIIGGSYSLTGASDLQVVRDEEGNPYIPASSIMGALKHAFEDYEYAKEANNYDIEKARFWGGKHTGISKQLSNDSPITQSALTISDLTLLNQKTEGIVSIRDGIKIEPETRLTTGENKFDYEIVEPGVSFSFNAEVVLREAFDEKLFAAFADWMCYMLQNGRLSLGAKTGQGFGRCKIEKFELCKLCFSRPEDVSAWLRGEYPWKVKANPFTIGDFKYNKKEFVMDGDFWVKNSLIIGSYPGSTEESDKIHLASYNAKGEKVKIVPGPSIKGAIRARAERIAHTLGLYDQDAFNRLFGWVETRKGLEESKAIKGRIEVEECRIVEGTYNEEVQQRIKVDRFTGGTIQNALFNSTPLWSAVHDRTRLKIRIVIKDYKPFEAGLMLLVLKDLWNGDLALGGEKSIGRGVLGGQRAVIRLDNQKILIEQASEGKLKLAFEADRIPWNDKAARTLEKLVSAFHNYLAGKEVSGNGC